MGTFISILIVIVSVLLILVVLIQNSKGGGLSSSFASSNQVMGVRKTADFLEKSTWTLAIALLALCLVATPYSKTTATGEKDASESVTRKKAENAVNNAPVTPTAPVGAPVGSAPVGVPATPPADNPTPPPAE